MAALLLYGFLTPLYHHGGVRRGRQAHLSPENHSLYSDRDLDVRNNVERRDWAMFYWGRPGQSAAPAGGFPVLSFLAMPSAGCFSRTTPWPDASGRR
jgi:hypothetical protein